MKSRSCKAKGRRLQNLIAAAVLARFPQLTRNDVRPAVMGERGADLKLSEAALEVFPFAVESKNQEAIQIWAAIRQAEAHAKQDPRQVPLVVFARNHTVPYVALPLADFLSLLPKGPECPPTNAA